MKTTHRRHNNHNHHEEVTQHARALVAATGHIAEEKVAAARERLSEIVESAKDGLEYVEDKAIEGAREANAFIREKPYQAVGLGIALGALIGYAFSRRK